VARTNHCAGFTLVEALVAVTLLAVGLLGLTALMVDGLAGDRIALQHSQAALLVSDMAERIRGNRAGGPAYALTSGSVLAAPAVSCAAPGECTPARVAALDLYRWQQRVLAELPDARTSIIVGPGAAPAYRIEIEWSETGAPNPARVSLMVQA
jgi:type IV pilus assembly protein PilV